MPIIVNADDFGLSSAVNAAIVESLRQGWISSATLMGNMPGFDEAAALTRQHGLLGSIGVHLNLTEGQPLTEAIRRQPRLCSPDGEFRAKARNLFVVTRDEESAIHTELRAQVLACRQAGVEPSHLDSHHHVHTSWAIGGIALAIARELDIPFIRPAHNAGTHISGKHKLYSALFNQRLRLNGRTGVRYFCNVSSATAALLDAAGGIEVMVHPILQADGRVTDAGGTAELGPLVTGLLAGRPAVSYGMLAESLRH